MDNEQIYKIAWRYDIWDDIEAIYPRGCIINCTVINVSQNYAFLRTADGICCFLSRMKVASRFQTADLMDILQKGDEEMKCRVIDYNHEKHSLNIALLLD